MMKIRYKHIRYLVNKMFIDYKINSYPVDILNLFSKLSNCKVVSYSKHMCKYNLTEDEVIDHFGSEEGCTIFKESKNRYLVFYNDLDKYYKIPERILWTLTHELAHIVLSHHRISGKTIIFRNTLNDDEYGWMEAESNRFASILLANPLILNEFNIKNYKEIKNICKLSSEASNYRYREYLSYKARKSSYINWYDSIILNQFNDFINKKQCLNCNHGFISRDAKFCPICGHNKLNWGDGSMIYEKIKLYSHGKAMTCPICNNEETHIKGDFCQICGTYIVNQCTNDQECGQVVPGNARFCELCGSETTFYKHDILLPWNNTENEVATTEDYDMSNVPF